MKNFSVEVDGKEYWVSRSVATAVYIFKIIENKVYSLIEKRGKGVDNSGKYCSVCGYLDFDETLREAATREMFEEVGVLVKPHRLKLYKIDSSPKSNRQNVTISYYVLLEKNEDFDLKKSKGGEKDEVDEVKWIEVGEFNKNSNLVINENAFKEYTFAFNHDNNIKTILKTKLHSELTEKI